MTYELDVPFHSQGIPLAGRFVLPTDDLTTKRPLVVVTGSWLTVKEQMPQLYARRLAQAGMAAFVFDFAGFGASGGDLRQCEMPLRKMADIAAAADFVRTMSFTRSVGHLAICASAQYTLAALARGARIESFASVAGWYHDTASIALFYGGREGVTKRLQWAQAAQRRWTGEDRQTIVPAYENGNERAGMFFPLDYYGLSSRGAIPEWKNEMDEMTWLYWLTFDGIAAASQVTTPSLLVHSDGCALPEHAKQIYQQLKGQKELVWSDGNQSDFYDLPPHVDRAMAAVTPWFKRTLA